MNFPMCIFVIQRHNNYVKGSNIIHRLRHKVLMSKYENFQQIHNTNASKRVCFTVLALRPHMCLRIIWKLVIMFLGLCTQVMMVYDNPYNGIWKKTKIITWYYYLSYVRLAKLLYKSLSSFCKFKKSASIYINIAAKCV